MPVLRHDPRDRHLHHRSPSARVGRKPRAGAEVFVVPRRRADAQDHRAARVATMTPRRLPAPWRTDKMPGGYVVRDANGQALAYVYSRANEAEALQAKVLTEDESRRIAPI